MFRMWLVYNDNGRNFVERKTQERKTLDKVKDWLDNNIEADITVDLIEDNKQLLTFIKEQELKATEWN